MGTDFAGKEQMIMDMGWKYRKVEGIARHKL